MTVSRTVTGRSAAMRVVTIGARASGRSGASGSSISHW
jgi:hypothetical protein